jgi:tRNA dimethylallyltransferase
VNRYVEDQFDKKQRLLLLAGPTAVGKSAIAIALAARLDGEIVSVDSMQVYRGMNIGTAKPSLSERVRVPHHLIDVAGIREAFDAAKFVSLAGAAVKQIRGRDRIPILCGGTGLYFKALLEGLGEAPPANPELRRELEQTSLAVLLEELAALDPVLFERIDRQNPRRIIRALEVLRQTGKTFSEQRAAWDGHQGSVRPTENILFIGLQRSVEDLRQRIDDRVDRMFELGLVMETQRLIQEGLDKNQTAMQAIGYRQVVEHLRGERSLGETIELVKLRTRQFAKRQMTWFRRQARVNWLTLLPETNDESVADQLTQMYFAPPR